MERFTDTFAIIFRPLCLMAAAFALAFLIGGIAQCFADEPTDWYDNEVSEQVMAEAKKQYRLEHGDWQPNLTPAAETELRHFTQQKQLEINRTFAKD